MNLQPACSRFATATDASAIAPRLAAALAARVEPAIWSALEVSRVLPRVDGGFTIQYCLPLRAGDQLFLGGLLTAEGAARPQWADRREDGVAWLDDLGLAVPAFPDDPALKSLPAVRSAAWRIDLARRLGWAAPADAFAETSAEVLAYRLEKRCVLRVSAAGRSRGAARAIVKVVRPRKLDDLVKAHAAPDARDDRGRAFTVPRTLHVDAEHGALVMEEAPGATLHALGGKSDLPRHYAAAGRALRALHDNWPATGACRTPEGELDQLRVWTATAVRLFPTTAADFARRLQAVVDARSAAALPDGAHTAVHRDFYDKQVMITEGRVTLLDLDEAAAGDPALDAGNFLAHVRLRRRQAPAAAASFAAAGEAFLAAYGADDAFLVRMRWWQGAALLRLAALYALRPRWRNLTWTLLKEVDACLDT